MNPIIVPIIIAVIGIQVVLSKQPRRYLGLILPSLSFLISVFLCVYFVVTIPVGQLYTITTVNGESYYFDTVEEMEEYKNTLDENDIVAEEITNDSGENASAILISVLRLGGGINIITLILLLIYRSKRYVRRDNQKADIQKMTIQDIE